MTTRRSRAGGIWLAIASFAVVLLLLLIFVLQNGSEVEISYLGGHGHLPLGVALLLAAVLGVLLVVIPGAARIAELRGLARRSRTSEGPAAGPAHDGPAAPGPPEDPAAPAPAEERTGSGRPQDSAAPGTAERSGTPSIPASRARPATGEIGPHESGFSAAPAAPISHPLTTQTE